MKKISSSMTARATIGALFFVIGVFLAVFGIALPALIYMFLAGIWLLRTAQASFPR